MFRALLLILLILMSTQSVMAQNFVTAKYGGDFLSVGGGARPLAMGGAFVGAVNDVTAGYWNPAGLAGITTYEVAYMHSERFSGIVGYDYGAIAIPLQESNAVVAVSFFRQGVDNIKNTLFAWDHANNRPLPDATDRFTQFSATDMAFFVSYAQRSTDELSWGATAKILNTRIGPFAQAWGYSVDLGLQGKHDQWMWGVNLMDVTTMLKFWDVNTENLRELTAFGDVIPQGQNERVLPTMKIGIGRFFQFGDIDLLTLFDTDIRIEGRRTYFINTGNVSYEPHLGAEITYKKTISLRMGLTDVLTDRERNLYLSPTVGAGFRFRAIDIDYGFGSFGGMSAELGYTHRLSMRVVIDPKKF